MVNDSIVLYVSEEGLPFYREQGYIIFFMKEPYENPDNA